MIMTVLMRFILAICAMGIFASAVAPTAYKGRFRPIDAEARLWLEDISHRNDASAEMLWAIHFLGHSHWDDTPLFWIKENSLKELLGLSTDASRFSYNQLHRAIYENKEINLRLMRMLLTYHFFKNYRDPVNRARSEKQELTALSPNLWVMFRQNGLVVAATPKTPPWNFIEPGMVVVDDARPIADSFEKKYKKQAEETARLLSAMQQYASMLGPEIPSETKMGNQLEELKAQRTSPQEISQFLESQYPLSQRLVQADSVLRVLPSRHGNGEWLPLKALNVKIYDPNTNQLIPVVNFTLYSDEQFNALRSTYQQLADAYRQNSQDKITLLTNQLTELLQAGYAPLAGTPYLEAKDKVLKYPTIGQLHAESVYYQYPLSTITMLMYGMALTLFLIGYLSKKDSLNTWGMGCVACAFVLHTALLCLRCYILQRPPVSNMFETIIYVPWIAVAAGFILNLVFERRITLIAGALAALILLLVLEFSQINHSLENVQAVLDSQYWLIIHVLLVVGSYGAFALCGILGHFYLAALMLRKTETQTIKHLGNCILQAMYIGLALLIPGTILGGVWAAESWGRFWDWDPKESWAFISICTYLICVHAYRFHHILHFGLAVGAIIGLQVISFTWYGVNYILGTGLHSYGFGSGGDLYYYLFLLAETIFLIFAWRIKKSIDNKKFYANLIK